MVSQYFYRFSFFTFFNVYENHSLRWFILLSVTGLKLVTLPHEIFVLILFIRFRLMSLKDSNSFVNLSLEGLIVFQHVNQFGIVDLQ